jgi:hypothetical protein
MSKEFRTQTLNELSKRAGSASSRHALLGFDGFVDKIVKAVATRAGFGDNFTPMREITEFGNRINAAAGKSANIELFTEMEKLGGNGPIMANAVAATGVGVKYVGALGQPVHSVFTDFAKTTSAVSLCDPGITHAVEFDDGKIMLGSMASLDELTYARIVDVMGEGAFIDAISRADLVGLVNWTMLPHMSDILSAILNKILPNLGPKESGRYFFFDLADPAKRSDGDIRAVLSIMSRYRSFGSATLGLNLAEAKQVSRILGHKVPDDEDPQTLKTMSSRIRADLDMTCVVIHPRSGAACATRDDAWYATGPFCEKPKISTGAGDHFNAGFATAQILGLTPPACLTVAVATSGQYVRTARSPSLNQTAAFIQNWTD